MASSGWQGQKDIQTSKYPHMALNLYISSISHSGTTLTYSGYVKVVCTSGNISYDGATVSLTGGGSKSINLHLSTGGSSNTGTFSCSISNVSASTTTKSVTASLSAGGVASGSASWTLSFPASQTVNPPSGGYVTYNSCTWDSVTFTTGLSSWGGASSGYNHSAVITGSTNGAVSSISTFFAPRREYFYNSISPLSHQFVSKTSNTDAILGGTPLEIKGLLHYKIGYYFENSAGHISGIDNTVRYLPPSEPSVSYTDPGGSGTKTYPVNVTGDLVNNHTTYDAGSLTRTTRYKVGSGSWVIVDSGTTAALDLNTAFNISIPENSSATVESYMTYHGIQGPTRTVVIENVPSATGRLYGSVSNQTKLLGPIYGSVNGQTKKLVRIYASVNGVTKKVYEDE